MDLQLTQALASNYTSVSQKARILTEDWVSRNMFCPSCGNEHINSLANNSPVADFQCASCKNEYELKSKSGKVSTKITDGAYSTMLERITSNQNPHLFVMEYLKSSLAVKNFLMIPNYFFVPEIIEKRKPLAETARRAGWVGCNILVKDVPQQGRIHIISNGQLIHKEIVLEKVETTRALATKDISSRGWLLDTLSCINHIVQDEFTLNDIYKYEKELAYKHPDNNNVQAKIRQQLQLLRDKGFIQFVGRGKYKKIF